MFYHVSVFLHTIHGIIHYLRIYIYIYIFTFRIIIVGIGSTLFHGTLLFSLQLLDEVPMLFCVLTLCYSVIENKKEKKFGVWFPITLSLWGLIVTLTMILSGMHYHDKVMQSLEFYMFQGMYPYYLLFTVKWLQCI